VVLPVNIIWENTERSKESKGCGGRSMSKEKAVINRK
jgi:hypothetical protein